VVDVGDYAEIANETGVYLAEEKGHPQHYYTSIKQTDNTITPTHTHKSTAI
jgi:hypothetical protein